MGRKVNQLAYSALPDGDRRMPKQVYEQRHRGRPDLLDDLKRHQPEFFIMLVEQLFQRRQ
ncbi:MAG: hypothetical protein ACRD1W_15165 [Vicinamibacterales bacterium]